MDGSGMIWMDWAVFMTILNEDHKNLAEKSLCSRDCNRLLILKAEHGTTSCMPEGLTAVKPR
jgi:hypothetical protein